MKYSINQAVVIGSGTMGAAIAAHLANAGIQVALLDIIPFELTDQESAQGLSLDDPSVRNRIVNQGFQAALKSKPASFYSKTPASMVRLGNLEDDFELIKEADWVIEVIIENLKIKKDLMKRIDDIRSEHTIISTNTSGIPITSIAEGRSKGFREHFLGTHFFNPPRYLKLVEIIPTNNTLEQVVADFSHFAEYRLGKGVVLCKDTPNFIANRMGFGSGAFALDYILKNNYTVKEVDSITGPLIGRPKSATFRLLDLVGLDVWEHVGSNLVNALPENDQAMTYLKSKPANQLISSLVKKGWLGNKSRQGFYKQVDVEGNKEFWPLNLEKLVYEAAEKVRFDSVKSARGIEDLGQRITKLLEGSDRAADLARAMLLQGLSYASHCIPEISDTPKPIDDAMRWGFGHEAGPFEIWDMLGLEPIASEMEKAGYSPASWVDSMIKNGVTGFYERDGKTIKAVYDPVQKKYITISTSPKLIRLDVLKNEKTRVLSRNTSASLIDLGDGVACIEFQTKMNAIDDDTLNMMNEALDYVLVNNLEGLVIGSNADNFSVGANLFGVVMASQNEMWEELDLLVQKLQNVNMRMRYFPKPVVIAPAGMALGGGSEIIMHGSRVVAAAELYAGLVEVGAGVIPAGGGTKEMVRRIINPPLQTKNVVAFPYLERLFTQIGQGEVAKSALEAQEMGILSPEDRIVINRDHLLEEAKREVLHMVEGGYQPPPPEKVYAAGRDALSGLKAGLYNFREAGYITEYEGVIGGKLIQVMCGGNLSKPAWMAESYFLDLEREAFLSLCGEKKTQERMWHLLQKGKVLRN
ncbi:MAG: 3-hydroxyacyl-CoA dehydrogenase NAD-binding domain-containing protein [Anaerolineales bacterium]